MRDGSRIETGAYDPLIDAERESLGRSGRNVGKIALIKATREATGLGLADAKDAVEGYLKRRGGLNSTAPNADRPAGWIDDLLDAERATASREDRPINKIVLIKALREASGLGLKPAKDAVEGYLRRRGGENLPTGSRGWKTAVFLILVAVVGVVIWWIVGSG